MSSKDHQKLLSTLHKNLQFLQERAAKFGQNIPPELINQIDDHNEAIQEVELARSGQISAEDLAERLAPLNLGVGVNPQNLFQTVQTLPRPYRIGVLTIGVVLIVLLLANTLLNVPGLQVALSPTETATSTPTFTPSVTFTPSPTPTATPTPITEVASVGQLLVIIAEFENTGNKTYKAHRYIFSTLQEELGQTDLGNVRVSCCAPVISGDDAADIERARELGQHYQAAFVIWGWSDDSGIEVKFSITRPFQNQLDKATVIRQPLLDLDNFNLFVTNQLPQQIAFLTKFSIGQLYFRDQNNSKANQIFNSLLENYPLETTDKDTLANLFFFNGFAIQNLNKLDEAVNQYRQATRLNPNLYQAYYNSGIAYTSQDQYDEAIKAYTHAISIKPDLADAYLNRGDAYWVREKREEALKDFAQVLGLDAPVDTQIGALINQGQIYDELNNFEPALASYEQAVTLNPTAPIPYLLSGQLLEKRGDFKQAQVKYQKAAELFNPQEQSWYYLETHRALAWVYYLDGDFSEAIEVNRSLLAQSKEFDTEPDNQVELLYIRYNLALSLLASGQAAEAEVEYAVALDLTSEPAILEEAIADLEKFLAVHPDVALGHDIKDMLRQKFKP